MNKISAFFITLPFLLAGCDETFEGTLAATPTSSVALSAKGGGSVVLSPGQSQSWTLKFDNSKRELSLVTADSRELPLGSPHFEKKDGTLEVYPERSELFTDAGMSVGLSARFEALCDPECMEEGESHEKTQACVYAHGTDGTENVIGTQKVRVHVRKYRYTFRGKLHDGFNDLTQLQGVVKRIVEDTEPLSDCHL